jgi:hypothetical protein
MTPSVSRTLKFYNALLIGAGLIFAFGFFERLTSNRRLALVATFFLLALPSYMNHFIWAQSLAIPLMLISFYGFERAKEEQRFAVPAAVAAAAVAVTHPAVAAVFAIFFTLYAVVQFYAGGREVLVRILGVAVIAVALAGIFYVPTVLKFGLENTASGMGLLGSLVEIKDGEVKYLEDTSGNAVYGVSDFLFPQSQGKIDQQTGIGLIIAALCIMGVALFMKDMRQPGGASWLLCCVIWLLVSVLGVEGNLLPVRLFPHRIWVYLSIPVALLSAYAYTQLEDKTGSKKRGLVAAVMVMAVLYTSAAPKYDVEMASWPPGSQLLSMPQIQGYVYMEGALPEHTMVFPLCTKDNVVVGFGMRTDMYGKEYAAFSKTAINQSADDVYAFLAPRNYSYVVLDIGCTNTVGEERANAAVNDYMRSGNYVLDYSNDHFFLFKLKR